MSTDLKEIALEQARRRLEDAGRRKLPLELRVKALEDAAKHVQWAIKYTEDRTEDPAATSNPYEEFAAWRRQVDADYAAMRADLEAIKQALEEKKS